MNARILTMTLAAFVALQGAASAQSAPPQAVTPQTAPPQAVTPQAAPVTVTGPGGSTTLPPNGSTTAPSPTNGTDASGNVFTATGRLGPQTNLGQPINATVHYIVGDYIAPPIVYGAYTPGTKATNYRNFAGRAAFEIPLGQYNVYVGGEARRYTYQSRAGFINGLGSGGRFLFPSTTVVDFDEDVRAGVKLIGPRVYAAVSGLRRGSSTGEYNERGLGYGIEKLADVDQNFSLHGNVFYYPNVGGAYRAGGASNGGYVSYRMVRYLVGASISPNHSPLFLDAGFLGDRAKSRTDAPSGFQHQGPFVGLGIHF